MQRIFHFLKPYRRDTILAMFLVIAMTAGDLATPRLVQRIIDQGISQGDMGVIVSTSVLMLGAAVFSALMSIGNTVLAVRVTYHFAADLRSALFRRIQGFSFGDLDRLQTGQLLVRLTSDVSQVQNVVLMSLRIFARAPLMMVGSLILMITISSRLASIMWVMLPVTLGLIALFVAKGQPLFLAVQRKLDSLNTVLQENLAGVRVVKAFVRAEHENARFDLTNVDLMAQTTTVMRMFSVLMPTLFLTINLAVVAVVWFGGLQVSGGTLTMGETAAFINYVLSTIFPLLMTAMMVGVISAAQASAGRIVEVLESTPAVQDRPAARPLPDVQGRIAFEEVSFSYSGDGGEPVLEGINLVAEPGETVAILGETGSGKSTLTNLIPRFYDVTSGRVTIDGIDVRDVTLESLRSQIAISLQESVLFSGTIRDNIRYGRMDASDEEVLAAAKVAQAHEFIAAFPDGYDTRVGQRGVNLSGGQKQRIAIARALLVQPRILILDDSTSSVDADTEARMQTALEEVMADRTTFVIAQRISTVLNADKIVVLERGGVAAVGTHAELIESSSIYQEIYESQLGDGPAAAAPRGGERHV
ncbi:MAG TPA: ABC transporter ATP-binding protein [Anaerolineae bacterium]|nr:ABC transporter ATP-binding protein [Anaerolineae bacterium]